MFFEALLATLLSAPATPAATPVEPAPTVQAAAPAAPPPRSP